MKRTRYAADGSLKTSLATIPDHAHAGAGSGGQLNASNVFSTGALPHERGGLETDVSAYDGFPLITGGATSPVTTVGVSRGGTGRTSLTANNILVGDGANAVAFLAPGTSGNVPVSNGTTWASQAPSVATLVARTELGSDAANIDLTSIPSTYKHLLLLLRARSDRASNSLDNLYLRFNNDSNAANYFTESGNMVGTAGAWASLQALGTGSTGIEFRNGLPAATSPSNAFACLAIWIQSYADTGQHRIAHYTGWNPSTEATNGLMVLMGGGKWINTADAISRITLLPVNGSNLVTGSDYTLYGYN